MSEPAGTERERCLEAARDTVMHRGALYRPPLPFFQKLAKRWSLVLGVEVTARQVLLCLIDLKTERATGAPHPDTVIDIAGYAACLAEVDSYQPACAEIPAAQFLAAVPKTAPVAHRQAEPASPHWARVVAFAHVMDEKLLKNVHKGDWREAPRGINTPKAMLDRLREEVEELTEALKIGWSFGKEREAIRREAADVANFALMIADLFGGGMDS